MKQEFIIHIIGDWEVGISSTEASVTIDDNICRDDEYIQDIKEMLADFYDCPIKCVSTFEEWDKQTKAENKFYEDYEKSIEGDKK